MFYKKSWFAGCAVLLLAATAVAAERPGFPRVGSINISAPHDYDDPSYQAKLAKVDMAVLNYWPGWESTRRMTMEQVVRNIKAINPDTKIFLYQNSMEVSATSASVKQLRDKLDQMHWWAYPSGTSGGRILSRYGANTGKEIYATNTTLFTPRDGNGYQWWEYHARWAVAKYYKVNPSIAGLFEDNAYWRPRIDADWNRDGVTDPKEGTNAGKWLREGYRQRFALLHQLMPGKYVIANLADWGHKDAVLTELSGTLDGGVMEGILGTAYSPEQWGSWPELMRWYRKTMAAVREPKLVMFDQHGDPTDYQAVRYGLASCLMDDAYYAFSSKGYAGVYVFDEYDADLGQAVSPPALTPWQKGVYRRDFENGIALVNPKGNGPVEVELEVEFRHIAGKQAPAVNNGQTTRKVQLKDRDGIILLRAKGLPSAPKLIAVH
jgi:hypothetical protein